ncbi:MAG TPA: hypothetical protein VLX56_04580 [Nitrososphaerales archaeon]|nr:hypothetical protein [Nitrososphaerales archaeon]
MPSGIAESIAAPPWTEIRVPAWTAVNPTVTSHAPITIWRKPIARNMGTRARIRKYALVGAGVAFNRGITGPRTDKLLGGA